MPATTSASTKMPALITFDPNSGALTGQAQIPGGAAAAPAVAGQTIYVVSRSGQLHAFR